MLISFVCTGNICRSPSAALIARKYFHEAGLGHVEIASAGTSNFHIGEPAHQNVHKVLSNRGYDTEHSARGIGEIEKNADLIITATSAHKRHLEQWGLAPEKVKLLRSFDDYADSQELDDPYYSDIHAYEEMADQIESAMPGIVQWVKDHDSKGL